MRRFEHTGGLTDIEQAISAQSNAVSLNNHADKPGLLNNLANPLAQRRLSQSHQFTPEDHAHRPRCLDSVCTSFTHCFHIREIVLILTWPLLNSSLGLQLFGWLFGSFFCCLKVGPLVIDSGRFVDFFAQVRYCTCSPPQCCLAWTDRICSAPETCLCWWNCQ